MRHRARDAETVSPSLCIDFPDDFAGALIERLEACIDLHDEHLAVSAAHRRPPKRPQLSQVVTIDPIERRKALIEKAAAVGDPVVLWRRRELRVRESRCWHRCPGA